MVISVKDAKVLPSAMIFYLFMGGKNFHSFNLKNTILMHTKDCFEI